MFEIYSNTGYSLSVAGYDVWLFNARGTGLSRTYSIYSKAGTAPRMNKMSWDFRYDLMVFTSFVFLIGGYWILLFCPPPITWISLRLCTTRDSFFIFSFHEMGIYDFPAAVDFVLNKTGRPKLDVIGYSLGATIALVGLSEKPSYNNKVDKLVLMAPTTRMTSYGFPISAFHRGSLLFKVTIHLPWY